MYIMLATSLYLILGRQLRTSNERGEVHGFARCEQQEAIHLLHLD
jgi:hypothetical protein